MSVPNPENPKPFLNELISKRVVVKLKWSGSGGAGSGALEYVGMLKSTDDYMNIHLVEAEEWVRGEFRDKVGEMLIRCNNVLYIRAAGGNDDDEMGD